MPLPATSWFRKLRGRGRRRWKQGKRSSSLSLSSSSRADDGADGGVSAGKRRGRWCQAEEPAPVGACSCAYSYSPNRASYYFASADRDRRDGGLRCIATRDRHDGGGGTALDIRVDVVHRRAAVRLGGIDAPPVTPELKLPPPILTRIPAAKDEPPPDNGAGAGSSSSSSGTTTSAATTPSTRARGFHVKPAGRRRRRRHHGHHDDDSGARKEAAAAAAHAGTRRRRWLYDSLVVVKESSDPEREMAESMAEMVVANRIASPEDLEELLACYLALNAAEHHRAVVAAFRRVWLWLHLARPQRSRGAPP